MKVNEIYTSIQGEGPNTGIPTTFVRFGGCNLRCPGWGTYLVSEDGHDIVRIGTEVGLPVDKYVGEGTILRGCDTIHAVYPQFRKQWTEMTCLEIAEQCQETAFVTFTGGEPLIQSPEAFEFLGV